MTRYRDLAAEVEALRRENERLRLIASRDHTLLEAVLEHSPYGVIVCDAEGALILHNPAAERIWAGSATAEDVASWGKYRAFHDDGRPFAGEDWDMWKALTTRRVVDATEYRIQKFDDSHGWLLGSCAPLIDADGELIGAVAVFADITPYKQLEADSRRVALEIHDNVVQAISAAKLAAELDRREDAVRSLAAALDAARAVVSDLLAGGGALEAGDLRRAEPAAIE